MPTNNLELISANYLLATLM